MLGCVGKWLFEPKVVITAVAKQVREEGIFLFGDVGKTAASVCVVNDGRRR